VAGVIRKESNGAPITLMTVVPAAQGEIIDNWNTLGMSGTGSHDVALNGLRPAGARRAFCSYESFE
jgi:hypothetical protein